MIQFNFPPDFLPSLLSNGNRKQLLTGNAIPITIASCGYDFRQKVIQAIELDGYKKSEASEIFNISRNTIDLWFKRKAATGDVQAKPRAKGEFSAKDHGLGGVSGVCQGA